ncbi:hypothetical protein UFOVP117_36 [uncultured Caudovirales phage]|uniref:Phage tail tape measure protein n=1 Tax=uncultured Caudovirales phage TaxID=2100421 RepID=A0A6J5L830_9CAUD|nr:hypothetical protein UFOVP117_36 [uncultured Caudovirales phage]
MLHYLQAATPDPDPLGSYFKSGGLKQYAELADSFTEITKTIQSMDVEMTKVVKTMGLSATQGLAIKQNFSQSYQSIVDLGGKISDVVSQQEALSNVSGRNLISLQSQSEELFAAVSVTGLKAEELQKSFYDAGMEGAHIAENVTKIVQVSNQLGVNAQAVSSTVTANLDKLNRFGFTNGVEGLAKMAGKAQALRFDMNETLDLADDLMSPEKAIETAAAIQRLGGAATALNDPLKLMDLAQNDVGGLQDELGKLAKQYTYFDEKTESFQIMPGARRQLKEVADALGIDRKEFEKMALETSKLDDKMSKIKFSGLDISKEDKEQLANLAQLQTSEKTGKKEYVVNYKDTEGKMQQAELASLSREQLEAIKKQTAQDSIESGEDPQKQLVKLAKDQLGEFGRLAAAQEKLANTVGTTMGGSKAGQLILKDAADQYDGLAKRTAEAFGPNSEFGKNMNGASVTITNVTELLQTMLSGNFSKIVDELASVGSIAGKTAAEFVKKEFDTFTSGVISKSTEIDTMNANVTNATLSFASLDALKTALGIGDGYYTPVGDTIKTPSGNIEIHEKDYFLAATQLPDVLQKSVNKGLMDVLKIQGQSMNAAMMSTNTQTQPQTQPQKQEVVHTVNFKVSVDGPKNKLTDMLVEELPKNPSLMQYIVKHFDNTKTSGGMIVKK